MADEQKPAGQANPDSGATQTPEQIAAAAAAAQQTPEQKAAAEAAASQTPEQKAAAETAAAAAKAAEVKTPDQLHDAAIAATEAWQANPTPENKAAAQEAVKKAKEGLEADKTAKAAEAEKNKVPTEYKLSKPEKSLLSDEHVARIAAFAKEQGLTNDKAQALLNRESQVVADARTQVGVEADAKLAELQTNWIATAKDDKEIGGANFTQNAELSRRVLATFGTPEFNAILEDPKQGRFGNHPELVRVFSRIGKAMSEDKLVNPGAQGEKGAGKSFADKFYSEVKGSGVETKT